MQKYQLLVTGGGTMGHVFPISAVIQALEQKSFKTSNSAWIGEKESLEQKESELLGIDFYPVKSGKLRRYFSFKNISDLIRVYKGIRQARALMQEMEPRVIFSTGGYISLPIILAARRLKIPVVLFEPNSVMGLSNKIAVKHADTLCLSYEQAQIHVPKHVHIVITGTPVRDIIESQIMEKKPPFLDGTKKPLLFFIGGSQGASFFNDFLTEFGEKLMEKFFIVHQYGPQNKPLQFSRDYKGYPFIKEELPALYRNASLVISRAGSVIFELAVFRKASILVPLPKSANNHQYLNARFVEQKQAAVLVQQSSGKEYLYKKIVDLYENEALRNLLGENIFKLYKVNAAHVIADLLMKKL